MFLLHVTDPKTAESIVKQGFDDRLCSRCLYGRGVYFTTEPCKAVQYCGNAGNPGGRTMILARVLLGHPFLAEGPMETHQRPSLQQTLLSRQACSVCRAWHDITHGAEPESCSNIVLDSLDACFPSQLPAEKYVNRQKLVDMTDSCNIFA